MLVNLHSAFSLDFELGVLGIVESIDLRTSVWGREKMIVNPTLPKFKPRSWMKIRYDVFACLFRFTYILLFRSIWMGKRSKDYVDEEVRLPEQCPL